MRCRYGARLAIHQLDARALARPPRRGACDELVVPTWRTSDAHAGEVEALNERLSLSERARKACEQVPARAWSS